MLSPDSSALLVMDDPVGVEAEPVPNAILFASERTGRVFRMDSVWSAAPSPEWTRLAIGRAIVLGGGESQRVTKARWDAPAAGLRALLGPRPALAAESLRAHSFPASGMGVVEASAVTVLVDALAGIPTRRPQFIGLGGWRVRWSCDGRDVLVGGSPRRANDDEPSESEHRIAIAGGDSSPAPAAAAAHWNEGPRLEAGDSLARDSSVIVATRNGHFVLAIVRRLAPQAGESRDHAVVFRVP